MAGIKGLLQEPTDKPVESSKSVGWFNITLIKVGVFISLPGFVTGVKIGDAVGFYNSILAFFLAGIVLGGLASLTATVGAKSRLSTYMITQYAFGTKGALLINLIFALSLFGWFGINTALFGGAVLNSLAGTGALQSEALYSILGGVLMVATAIFGFKALDKVSQLAVPLLCISLVVLVYVSITKIGFATISMPRPQTMSVGKAISAVIGGSVVGTVIFPDICRYARTFKHGIIAGVLTFTVAKPLILMTSAVPSLATGLKGIMDILNSLNLGVMALGVVIFTTWTSNNGNLYGASLSLSTIFRHFRYWQLVIISGTLGTILAITGLIEHFVPFLHLLGIALPPVAGIYIAHYFFISRGNYSEQALRETPAFRPEALAAWFIACLLGYATLHDYVTLTTVPAMDSLIASGFFFYVLKKSGIALLLLKFSGKDARNEA
jgi:cytosine permease